MVFSSVPAYLDPHNWQQQQPRGESSNSELPSLVPPLPPTRASGGTIRPGSMAERARLAKLPQPEVALKCPRCESTNTKFCYFNNYSLSQPRHFCKTCRRYWTRGGALRNVPVGGGCRRNKRSKGINRSKSPSTIGSSQAAGSTSTVGVITSNNCTTDMIGQLIPPPPQLPLLSSLPHLSDYGSANIGLNFAGIETPVAATGGVSGGTNMEFQIGSSSSGGGPIFSARFGDQWRLQQLQQFSFLTGLEPPSGIYPFEGDQATAVNPSSYAGAAIDHQLGSKGLDSGVSQPATVKMEENQGLDLSRNFLGLPRTDQYWGGNAWTDLSGFTSSSSTHLL